MAHIVADRVKETASNKPNGSTAFDLPNTGATGYRAFDDVMASNDTCFYLATNGTLWEVGTGTFTAGSPDTLARASVVFSNSSNSTSRIDFSAGGDVTVEIVDPAVSAGLSRLFGQQEISITGTGVTATLDHMHVCSGTSSDYTVTLPAVSGNTGRLIGFRMSNALTKLVTIDGNSTETIDGATTRVMWAGEAAILLCDGSQWVKIAGRSIPMEAALSTSVATTVSSSSETTLTLNTSTIDNTGMMNDTANSKSVIKRDGKYLVSIAALLTLSTQDATLTYVAARDSATGGAGITAGYNGSALDGAYLSHSGTNIWDFTAGDYVILRAFQNAGVNRDFTSDSRLSVVEVLSW